MAPRPCSEYPRKNPHLTSIYVPNLVAFGQAIRANLWFPTKKISPGPAFNIHTYKKSSELTRFSATYVNPCKRTTMNQSVNQSDCLSVCLSVCLSIYLSVRSIGVFQEQTSYEKQKRQICEQRVLRTMSLAVSGRSFILALHAIADMQKVVQRKQQTNHEPRQLFGNNKKLMSASCSQRN